jgi:hypothetical protein
MSEMAQDAWFFTVEGERTGPVSLADLRTKAANGELNPRLDMVWTRGMEDWKPSGEIDGLFEKRNEAAVAEPLAPTADPYTAPKQDASSEALSSGGGWPGARRRMFLIMTIVFPILWQLGFTFGAGFLGERLGPEIMVFVTLGAMIVPVIVAICFGLQRLANLGMSRWWYLGHFVPILHLWVGYRSVACPAGYAYHKKLDGIGWLLAILYWLGALLVLAAIAAIIAILFGAVNQPELRQQLEELLRQASARTPKP